MVKIKVCGMTRAEDVRLACDLGATAIGFVFWTGSSRHIAACEVRTFRHVVPPDVEVVGVFVNPSRTELDEIVSEAGLTAVQLHGDETVTWCAELPYQVIKAIPVEGRGSIERALMWPEQIRVLLDVHDPIRRGGTGEVVDWSVAASIAARRGVMLAGGLTAENVGDALAVVRPEGVDVSSGVERSPGVKDPARLRRFFEAVAAYTTRESISDPRGREEVSR